jgi:hypothetical protein
MGRCEALRYEGGGVMYLVLDNPFNRAWCAELIGAILAVPPSYCIVERVS